MTRAALLPAFALLLAACEPLPVTDAERVTPAVDTSLDAAEDAVPTGMDDTCRAQRFADRIGQPIDGADFGGALELRVLRPGELYSEDYVPQRLNVGVSSGGTIFRLWCG